MTSLTVAYEPSQFKRNVFKIFLKHLKCLEKFRRQLFIIIIIYLFLLLLFSRELDRFSCADCTARKTCSLMEYLKPSRRGGFREFKVMETSLLRQIRNP